MYQSKSLRRVTSSLIPAIAALLVLSCIYPMPTFDNPYDPKGTSYHALDTVTDLIVTAGDGEVALSWTATVGATSYEVHYKAGTTATVADTKVAASLISGTTAAVPGLANGTRYAFVVIAVGATNSGPASGAATATPTSGGSLMLPVAGGTFNNGSSDVTVSSFSMSKFETTQAQYMKVTGSNPSQYTCDTSRPVDLVT